MSKNSRVLVAVLAIFAALGVTGVPALSQTITLKLHTFIPPPANPYKTFLAPWAKRIEKASKGRLKIQLYPSMQLGGKPPQLLDQIKDG